MLQTIFSLLLIGHSLIAGPDVVGKPKVIYIGSDYQYNWDVKTKTLMAIDVASDHGVANIQLNDLSEPTSRMQSCRWSTFVEHRGSLKHSKEDPNEEIEVRFSYEPFRFNEIDLSHVVRENKIFDATSHCYFVFNVRANLINYLYLVQFDKAQGIFTKQKVKSPAPESKTTLPTPYYAANTYLLPPYLFQVYVDADQFLLEVKSLDNPEEVLRRFSVAKGGSIDFKHTPILRNRESNNMLFTTSGTIEVKPDNEIDAVEKFIKKCSNRNIGIIAQYADDKKIVQLTIGTYMYQATNYTNNRTTLTPIYGEKEERFYFLSLLHTADFEPLSESEVNALSELKK